MKATTLELDGLLLLEPRVFGDARGFFFESYNQRTLREVGIATAFVQDNHSRSARGVLRGMHFQKGPGQAKLVRVASGRIWDVAVDIRPASPTFGRWAAAELDAESHRQLFVPAGFAHGFCVLSEHADVLYKVSTFYDASSESDFRWDDPDVGIAWPIASPVVSDRDAAAPSFAQLARELGR